ncbi:1-phosphofructokinase [Lachnospiraceae bacterium ZAX-1]
MLLTVTLNAAIDKRYVVEDHQKGEVNRVKQCDYVAGGKGLNVSKTAVIAGAEVLATGFVGGHAGNYIIEAVEAKGVKTDFVRVNGESRSCINIYDEKTKTQTEFLEPGPTVTKEEQEAFYVKYKELLKACNVVAISGSIPKGIGMDMYPKLVAMAKEAGKKVIIDTSGNLLEKAILAKPDMIKPNIDEIRLLTGEKIDSDDELIKAGIALQKSGIACVVISLGGDGALMFTKDGVLKAKIPSVDVVNTTGCGDTMIAGFAVAMEQGMSLKEAFRFSSAASTASAMQEETGFYVKEDMKKLLLQIKVEEVQN